MLRRRFAVGVKVDVAVNVSWWATISESICVEHVCLRSPENNNVRLGRSVRAQAGVKSGTAGIGGGIQHELKATVSPGCYHGCGRTQDGRGLGETASQPWAGVERLTRNSIKATRKEYLLSSVHSATCDECRNLPSRVLLCSCFTYIMTASRCQPCRPTHYCGEHNHNIHDCCSLSLLPPIPLYMKILVTFHLVTRPQKEPCILV